MLNGSEDDELWDKNSDTSSDSDDNDEDSNDKKILMCWIWDQTTRFHGKN